MARRKDHLFKRRNGIYAFRWRDSDGTWREKHTGTTDRATAVEAKDLFEKYGLYRGNQDVFAFKYRGPDGAWKERYTDTTDAENAKVEKNKFDHALRNGDLPTEMAEWTLGQAKQWWLEFRKCRVAVGTLTAEQYRLKPMIRILGNIQLKQITNVRIDDYVTKRLGEGIGNWSINKEVMGWSMILAKAKLWRHLELDYRQLPIKVSDIGRALTRQELRDLAVIASTNKAWEAAFYGSVLASNTGMRGGEVKRLRIGEIDLERRRIRIRRADTKTDAGSRIIELNRDATEAAARLIFRASQLKPPATKPEHYLAPKHLSRVMYGPNKGKRGYDPTQHMEMWDTAWKSLTSAIRCQKCGKLQGPSEKCCVTECGASMKGLKSPTEGLNFHSLRHTFITHLVELGVPVGVIQTFVGHMSARMTAHYTHISSGVARKAVELLDAEPMLAPAPINLAETAQDDGVIQ
jgi:integrase